MLPLLGIPVHKLIFTLICSLASSGRPALLSGVCGLNLTSFLSPMSFIVIKWSQLLFIALYVPILYMFYKQLLHNTLLVSIALLATFSLELLTFHYAAESYGQAIYWLILALILTMPNTKNFKYSLLALFAGLSLILVHKGLMILVLLAFTALVVYPLPFKLIKKDSRILCKKILYATFNSWYLMVRILDLCNGFPVK